MSDPALANLVARPRGLIAWFAANGVAANLIWILVLVGAVVALFRVKVEIFPELTPEVIAIGVPYPGATPAEVEEGINSRIEEAIRDLRGIKRLTSSATEGAGALTVEIETGYDPRRLRDDLVNRIEGIARDLPLDSERPVIEQPLVRGEAITLAVHGPVGADLLQRSAERVREELLRLPGITQVDLAGMRGREIIAELDEESLRRHGLSHAQVAQRLRLDSQDVPGGAIRAAGGDVLLRATGQARSAAAFAAIPILTQADGAVLRLGDIARVREVLADSDLAMRFNGEPAVMVKVYRVGEQNVFELCQAVRAYAESAAATMPPGVALGQWLDNSVWLRQRLDLLTSDTWQSLVLVVLILALFLGLRLGFWVGFGIPVSFLAGIALMPFLGVSVNMVSLFAFIIVIGIVVDDSIVVSEAIYDQNRLGRRGLDAAIHGTRSVVVPVVCSVLTTITAFLPMAFMPGTRGQIFLMIPAIAVPVMIFSLIETMLSLPNHLSHHPDLRPEGLQPRLARLAPVRAWHAVVRTCIASLEWVVRRIYSPLLEIILRWRYLAVATFLAGAVLVVGVIASGAASFTPFPRVEGDSVQVALTMPQGANLASMEEAVAPIEAAVEILRREFPGAVKQVAVAIGSTLQRAGPGGNRSQGSTNTAQVMLELAPAAERGEVASALIAARWRSLCGTIPGAVSAVFSSELGGHNAALEIQLQADDFAILEAATQALVAHLSRSVGVVDIADTLHPGKEELRLTPTAQGRALGLTATELGGQVRRAYFGDEVQRIQRGSDEITVYVRLPEQARRSAASLDSLRIRTVDGAEHPLRAVADLSWSRGYATIRHADGRRSSTITADVDAEGDAGAVLRDLSRNYLPALAEQHPGLGWSLEGQNREGSESLAALGNNFLIALAVIYALIAVPLRSWLQPLLIMSAIPMGAMGAILAHLVLGRELSLMSFIGVVALAGVVVNEAIVMVDYINQRRAEGMPLTQAVREAGARRFRPVMLTSSTTFVGLAPIIFEPSPQAQFMVPAAVSLGFGSVFATTLTLLLLPCGYLIIADLIAAVRWVLGLKPTGGD